MANSLFNGFQKPQRCLEMMASNVIDCAVDVVIELGEWLDN